MRPVARRADARVAAAVGIPIVGMGGVSSGADALEFLAAGAPWWRSGPRTSATRGPASASPSEIAGALAIDAHLVRPDLDLELEV